MVVVGSCWGMKQFNNCKKKMTRGIIYYTLNINNGVNKYIFTVGFTDGGIIFILKQMLSTHLYKNSNKNDRSYNCDRFAHSAHDSKCSPCYLDAEP